MILLIMGARRLDVVDREAVRARVIKSMLSESKGKSG